MDNKEYIVERYGKDILLRIINTGDESVLEIENEERWSTKK